MKYAIKHRAIKKYRKNKSANINCIVLSVAAFSIWDFLSVWFEADPNQYNYTISEPVCQFINCITVMFFGTAKCRANSRRLWSEGGGKSDAASVPAIQQTPETVMETVSGVEVIPTPKCKTDFNCFCLRILTWYALILYRLSQFYEVFLLLLSNSYHLDAITHISPVRFSLYF